MYLIQEHLPAHERRKILSRSKKFYAFYALRMANDVWHTTHNKKAVKAYIKEALNMHRSAKMYSKILKIYAKILLNRR
jgi:hypothetical protein